jgi:TrmH family RNA methyltransferase
MITSARNPKIVELRKLQQRKHRRAQQRFMVEGLQLIGMALAGGHQPLDIFYCEERFGGETAPVLLQSLIEAGGRPHALSARVMDSLSERDAPQGLIVTFPLIEAPIDDMLAAASPPSLVVVLDRLQDPGNLGTIIRTADAVAAAGVILIEPCVDLFDLKTVRGSMGSIFTVPVAHTAEPVLLFETLRRHGYHLTGADGYRGELAWAATGAGLQGSTALVLGNEARGLNPDLRPHLTHWTRLPMPGQAESLNVAVAGAVLMYQWVQQNHIGSSDLA